MLAICLLFCVFFALVQGFDFSTSPPTQCGSLDVTWSGGQPPFRLLLIPPAGSLRNISIPSSAFDGTHGSFRTVLNLATHQRLMISMSDATGITTGGISDVLTVGEPLSGESCNTTDPGVDFFFSLDADLKQCEPYPFTDYAGAVQPITITGFIPSSHGFVLYPSEGSQYAWAANLTAGTSVSFSVVDALGRVGGASSMRVVQRTDDESCLAANPTSIPGSMPTSGSPNPTETTSNNSSPDSTLSKTGLIVGLVAGGCALVAIISTLAFFCLRRRRTREPGLWSRRQKHTFDLTYDPVGTSAPGPTSYLLPENHTSSSLALSATHLDAVPLPTVTTYHDLRYSQASQSIHGPEPPIPSSLHELNDMAPTQLSLVPVPYNYMPPRSVTARESKQSKISRQNVRSSVQHTPHVIVHSDIDETMETPIELPPQYSEHRVPLPGFPTSESSTSSSSKKRR